MKRFLPFLIAAVFASITLLTLNDYGVTWDEGLAKFDAAEHYIKWLGHPRISTIDEYWVVNHQHPPLCKVASGITWYLFNGKFGRVAAHRISSALFVFLLISGLFAFSSRLYGNTVAFFVTTSFFFLPRVFFHCHLTAMDYPVTAMCFLTIYSYWRGIEDRKWMIYSSILMGLALLTKINGFLIYIPVFFYWVVYFRADFVSLLRRKPLVHSVRHIISKIIYMLIIPPVMFVLFWPWLWKDTLSRLMGYISSYIHHFSIPVYYFGKVYLWPPWHYPFVLTVITLPLIILIPFFVGIFATNPSRNGKTKLFILLNALLPLIAISRTGVPKHDGVRLFLPAFPFICMVSGAGIYYILNLINKVRWKVGAVSIYTFLLFITIFRSNIGYHPYQSSYFSEIIGGIKGAERVGMELEYWGHPYKEGVAWLNENAKPGSEISVMTGRHLPRFGSRADLKLLGNPGIDWLIEDGNEKYVMYINRKGRLPREISYLEKEMPTVFAVERSGVVLMRILRCDNMELKKFLREKEITCGYAEGVPLMTFKIDEKITTTGGECEDYIMERLIVDSVTEPAYILLGREAANFYQRVWGTGGSCGYERAGPFHVYYDFIAPQFGREPIPPYKWQAFSNCNQTEVINAFDGDIDTRWTTGERQRKGMYYEIDLGGIYEVNGICLLFPEYFNDYPDGYRLDVSLDGRKWENVLSVKKDQGSYFWMGERFFWRWGHDRRDIWIKPTSARFLRITQTGSDAMFWSIQELFVFRARERQLENTGDFSALIEFLDGKDIKYVYTDERLSARLAYETDRRIRTLRQYYIAKSGRLDKLPKEEWGMKPVVHFGKDMAIVLTEQWKDFFESTLNMYRMKWEKSEIGIFNVYHDIEPSMSGKILSRDCFTPFSSHNSSDCLKAIDGDMETRWSTQCSQEPGMYYGLDLGKVVEVCGIRSYHGKSKTEYPRKYEITVSLDGENWENVNYFHSGPYYWAGFTLLKMGHSQGRIELGFPPILARYIKMIKTGYNPAYYWSIHELEVAVK